MDDDVTCVKCGYYDAEDDRCTAFECFGMDCPPLPCEEKASSETE